MGAMERDQATSEPAKRARIAAIDAARGVALGGHGRLPPDLGLRPFRPGRADGAVRAGDAGAVAWRRQRVSRAGRRVAGARPSARAASRRVSQAPRADRRRGGAGDGGELCDRLLRADPVRHPALHRRRQPDRRAVRRRAALGGVGRRRSRRRGAARLFQRGVQPAPAGLARAWNAIALHARLAAAAAVGGRRADRARADAGGGAAARRLALDGVAAGALARPRRRLRRPAQPRHLSRPPADPVRPAVGRGDATGLDERHARDAYLATCPSACVAHGGDASVCAKACACVADRAAAAGLSLSAARVDAAGELQQRLRDVVETCSLEAR